MLSATSSTFSSVAKPRTIQCKPRPFSFTEDENISKALSGNGVLQTWFFIDWQIFIEMTANDIPLKVPSPKTSGVVLKCQMCFWLIDGGLCSSVLLLAYKGQASSHLSRYFCVITEAVYWSENMRAMTGLWEWEWEVRSSDPAPPCLPIWGNLFDLWWE